ncbi:MAG TPA: hypothetical protein VF552_01870 [Allosphingosinicella sp.]|jgi:hypothetical protein
MKQQSGMANRDLRLLSDEELTKVGGGLVTWGPDIFVTGWDPITGGGGGDGGGGGSDDEGGYTMDDRPNPETGGTGTGDFSVPKDTPCVSASPDGINLSDLNRVALALSRDIAAQNDDEWEYGAVIYALNGEIRATSVVTQQNPDGVVYPFHQIPSGAVVLALVQNHPEEPTVKDSIPSSPDWRTYERLLAGELRVPDGVSVDPKLLMYVYTNEDWKTRVYDKNDVDTGIKSCSLQ